MIECHIKGCMNLDDPFYNSEILSELTDERKDKILKLKNEPDRKRSLMAGLMIRDNLKTYGINQEDIKVTDNGRPYVSGIDFNVSHSGDYVVMALSDGKVGCDIEQVKDRNCSAVNRCFKPSEIKWIEESEDKILAFYRIWTARESYIKLTGEGILLDFKSYEVKIKDSLSLPKVEGDITNATPLGVAEVYREGKKVDCVIAQWLFAENYVISVCGEILGGYS